MKLIFILLFNIHCGGYTLGTNQSGEIEKLKKENELLTFITLGSVFATDVSMEKHDTIQQYDLSGNIVYQYKVFEPYVIWASASPSGLTMDKEGHLYFVDKIYDKMYIFSNVE